jgi:hypothetical protein
MSVENLLLLMIFGITAVALVLSLLLITNIIRDKDTPRD